jgi:Na+-transporting NADH:ubiquinone oxidoreductase subunit A
MVHIKISKGLNIPINGGPAGEIQPFIQSGTAAHTKPKYISLNLHNYDQSFKLLTKLDDFVKIGQPLVEDKEVEGRMYVAPASGIVREIRRGLKRRLLDIVIEVAEDEQYIESTPLDPLKATREEILSKLMIGGLFHRIRQRPFDRLANPKHKPRSIFVKALESAPFVPSSEMQVKGHEKEFQAGLDALSKLTDGNVNLVYRVGTSFLPFTNAKNVTTHTAEGPHPIANYSVHIHKIDPITSVNDCVWTLNAHDVVCIGHYLLSGRYYTGRVVGIGGTGIIPSRTGFFQLREGYPISNLISGRVEKHPHCRYISGDVLTGDKVLGEDFMGMSHYVFCSIPDPTKRELLHFFRLGTEKYSFSRAYLTGHLDRKRHLYDFSTLLHGEHRPFIDSQLYKKVMPLPVPTMLLCKAIMAEDYELAEELGLLEVSGEDFALPTFVDPSKMEMIEIVNTGLRRYAQEVLG